MELLILLQTRSDWKNTEYTARSLLTSLVLIYHDSPEALLRAWLDLRMVADDLYRLLYLDEVETLWVTPESAIMWLRYNALLVAKGVRGVMTVDKSLNKLLGSSKRQDFAEKKILPLLQLTEGKPKSDVELYTAVKEF